MNLSTFLTITALIGLVVGLGMLILPEQVFDIAAISLDEGSKSVARSLGALIVAVSLINWIARKVEDSLALRAILYGNLALHLLTMVADILAITTGAISEMGWVSVAVHAVLGAGFAYFAFAKPK